MIPNSVEQELAAVPKDAEVATFAGGCFWCIETPYDRTPGIYAAIAGYTGGTKETAGYYQVAAGKTEHRESVQVHYNPKEISYQELLEIFWRQIDPTDAGGQFADRGHHYTTAIYYHNSEQQKQAQASKQALIESKKFAQPIVTEILPFKTFFPAEEDHQNFAAKQAEYYQNYKKGSGRADYIKNTWPS